MAQQFIEQYLASRSTRIPTQTITIQNHRNGSGGAVEDCRKALDQTTRVPPAFFSPGQHLPEIEIALVHAIEQDADIRNRLYWFGETIRQIERTA